MGGNLYKLMQIFDDVIVMLILFVDVIKMRQLKNQNVFESLFLNI